MILHTEYKYIQVMFKLALSFFWRIESKVNNSKSIHARVMVLARYMASNVINGIYIKFREEILNWF